jgi:hypothetical protein
MGDHSEAIEIDFDPTVVSYVDLLSEFFGSHNVCRPAWSTQYRSAIFAHGAKQRAAAEKAANAIERTRGDKVTTAIEDFTGFTLAEAYHQKYRLRRESSIVAEYESLFPGLEEFLGSTAVTRANAFLDGHGTPEVLARDLPLLGLSDSARAALERRDR